MLPPTAHRVSENTSESVNERIRQQTEQNIARYRAAGPAAIYRRLAELDAEWDIERYLETMAPSITLLGITLGLTVSRKWFAFPILVQSFFLQHALQGWCPPLPVLRRMGVRTAREIAYERCALEDALSGHEHHALGGSRPGPQAAAIRKSAGAHNMLGEDRN